MIEGMWTVVTVFHLTKICVPAFGVWSGASDGELISANLSPSFPLTGELQLR